jgi:hypothetical protein
MTTTYGYFRQDDSDHWYLIPEELLSTFIRLRDQIDIWDIGEERDKMCDEFVRIFNKYRLSGGVESYRVVLEYEL